MIRELHFPTPIYILDIKDQNLNIQLEKDILNWMNKDKGVTRTNVKGWHSTTDMHTRPEFARLTKALHEAQLKIYDEEIKIEPTKQEEVSEDRLCPTCKNNLVFVEGCSMCIECGYSGCTSG